VAEKKSTIVIKKITIGGAGAHGGAWKVAFADFMTAMMCFFLVMWLLASASEPSKKAVSDYFSTPSIIEYNFSNYGVELSLEKLFLDLMNEPLQTLQSFMDPMDPHPNIMGMGLKKVVMAFMAEQLGDLAQDVDVAKDGASFTVPDNVLFEKGTANPSPRFVSTMEKIKGVVAGLEDTDMVLTSTVYNQSVNGFDPIVAKNVAKERLDLVHAKVDSGIEKDSVDIFGRAVAKNDDRHLSEKKDGSGGMIKFELKQKKVLPDGKKPRPLQNDIYGSGDADNSVYDNFVQKLTDKKKR
jgi:chemotaxis protein MotB